MAARSRRLGRRASRRAPHVRPAAKPRAGAPDEGINALDAVVAMYNAVSMLRQQVKSDVRIHGIILAGGPGAGSPGLVSGLPIGKRRPPQIKPRKSRRNFKILWNP